MEEIIRNLFAAMSGLKTVVDALKNKAEVTGYVDDLIQCVAANTCLEKAYEILSKVRDVNYGEFVTKQEEEYEQFIGDMQDSDDYCSVDADGEPTGATEIPDDFYGKEYELEEDEDVSEDVQAAIKSGKFKPVDKDDDLNKFLY